MRKLSKVKEINLKCRGVWSIPLIYHVKKKNSLYSTCAKNNSIDFYYLKLKARKQYNFLCLTFKPQDHIFNYREM